MNKKHLLLICMAIAFCLNPLCAQLPGYSGGSGTETSPFLIADATDLGYLVTATNDNANYSNGKYFELVADIDMQGVSFTPIGNTSTKSFKGHFDGAGHTISNLSLSGSQSYLALFGYISGATIENLNLIDCNVAASGVNYIGGVCANALNSTISNVTFKGTVVGNYSGLICSTANNSTIEYCVSSGSIKGSNCGGICGTSTNSSSIQNCCNLATIDGNGTSSGGICGQNGGSSSATCFIANCLNFGDFLNTNTSSICGGIVGIVKRFSNIDNCINACKGSSFISPIIGNEDRAGDAYTVPVDYFYSNLYFDYQICPTITNIGYQTKENGIYTPIEKTTGALISGHCINDPENWSEAPGRYPVPKGLENNPAVLFAASTYVVFSDGDHPGNVTKPIWLSQADGLTWSLPSGASTYLGFSTGNIIVYPKKKRAGTTTYDLTATKGAYTKSIPLHPTTAYSSPTILSGTSNASLSGNAVVTGNIQLSNNPTSVQDLYITNTGSVTIPTGSCLTVNGTIINLDPSKLVLEDGAQLIHNTEGVQATLTKGITGYSDEDAGDGWYFISSPILDNPSTSAVQLESNEGSYDLYRYNTASGRWENVKAHANDVVNAFTTLNDGQGYLYANSTGQDLTFAGTLSATHASIPLSYEGDGWNLVGNPFPCNATVDKAFYVCTGSEVSQSITSVIAPGQGIMVQATEAGESITFTKAASQQANNTHNGILAEVSMATRGAKLMDNARINFGESQLEKFYFNSNSCLYIPQGEKDYAMIAAEDHGTLPLCFVAPKNGEYTIRFSTENAVMEYLHLIDNLTGNDVDLLQEQHIDDGETMIGSYTFSAQTTDYASRFKLVFQKKDNNEMDDSADNNFAHFSDGQLRITNLGNATLQVFDMAGRMLISRVINGDYQLDAQNLNAGVYVVSLDGKTQKVVIK